MSVRVPDERLPARLRAASKRPRLSSMGVEVDPALLRQAADAIEAAERVAELRHDGMRVQSNGNEAIPRYKLVNLRERLGMPRG